MYPELFRIGDFPISTYGLMMAMAFLIGLWILKIEFERLKIPVEAVDMIFWRAAIGGIVGARIYYVILMKISGNPEPILNLIFSRSGMVFFGGLLGGALLVLHGIKKNKYPLKTILDAMAPVMVVAYGIGRIGCFFAGCCYGLETDLPWAITFSDPMCAAPTGFALHPTQLYETLASFGIFVVLWNLRKRISFSGGLFATYLAFAGLERFLIEFFRDKDDYLLGSRFTMAQFIGLGIIVFGIYLFSIWKKSQVQSDS